MAVTCKHQHVPMSQIIISVTLLLLLLLSVTNASDVSVVAGPPERPADFKNPEAVRKYFKELNDYFSLVGRPRFGRKRSATAHAARLCCIPKSDVEDDVGYSGLRY